MKAKRAVVFVVLLLTVFIHLSSVILPLALASPLSQDATFLENTKVATVQRTANLRAGPGTNTAIVGQATAGQTVTIIGQNAAGDWYQLQSGAWIAAFLVEVEAAPVVVQPPPAGQSAQVTNIVDGDTIDVSINGQTYRLRYILVDTPERGQSYFTEATEANRRLVGGKTVYLAKDVSETDRYGRLLRYVYLADGTFVNAELVRQGYALLATFPPDVAKEAEIRAAQQEAVNANRGLWAASATTTPAAPVITGAAANRNANLRGGPGTTYPVVGAVNTGQQLELVGRNGDSSWYQLQSGAWIAAFLVNNPPANLADTSSTVAQMPPAPVQPAAAPQVQPIPAPQPPPGEAKVVLQTVFYDGVVYRVESDEYAVIANVGTAPINIGGWRLNAGDRGQDFTFPSFELAPGQRVRVYTNEHHPESGGFSFGRGQAIWNNSGECGYLYDSGGAEVSSYCY